MHTVPDTIRSLTDEMRLAFRNAEITTADLDARLILAHVLDVTQARLISEPNMNIATVDTAAIRAAMKRRLNHEPVSRIIGHKEFWGRDFEIDGNTLDPRPDTESLIEAALKIIRDEYAPDKKISILDLGTGSGCIKVSVGDRRIAKTPAKNA